MAETFQFDVFLSHSSQDKPAVRELAERLRADGLRVWFDEWEIRPGDSIPLAIERGLENSRTLILAWSKDYAISEWGTFEHHTFLFRDPTNRRRRFIPLRLDDTEIKDSLKQFAYVDWRAKREEEYPRLKGVGYTPRDSAPPPAPSQAPPAVRLLSLGHTDGINGVAITPDGTRHLRCRWLSYILKNGKHSGRR